MNFLWGGLGAEFKHHLVGWAKVCTPKEYGGLGVRSLVLTNKALLGKWIMKIWAGRAMLVVACFSVEHVEFAVGQGRRVSFWKDKWCGDVTLGDLVPYAL
uniref:Reverse transcriptase zinc-binding domain-containing protein n=1 Tax=Fagus sylvatica TaxID=28930 RepID=A0A2N9EGB9_FAGSY